ncbi:MAG TPA: type II toxin-antitoxin system RelE/ParE family toxin [Chloroflexota bacterium]|nr:type II toxin-antitoxin system RelE/ParE family toxin [Chloroflexota bacterium]
MKVILSPAAEADLRGIYTYFADRDYDFAERLMRTLLRACDSLTDFPLLGKEGSMEGTRERLTMRYPYRIVYRIKEEEIEIVRILNQRQQWP